MAEQEQPGVLDMDAFWAEQTQRTTPVKVLGEVVQLPAPGTLPLDLERRMEAADARDEATMKGLLGEVFGDPTLIDRWEQGGMNLRQFRMLTVWVLSNGQGKPLTMQQAMAAVDAQMDGEVGEAPRPGGNRATRRAKHAKASSGTKSASSKSTGPSSRRTSPANTR